MKKLLQALLITLALCSAAQARESVPIINFENQAIITASGKRLSSDQIKAAIIRAASTVQWAASENGNDQLMSATLTVRNKHTMRVSIAYTSDKFSVTYKDSINMNYRVGADPLQTVNPAAARMNERTNDCLLYTSRCV